MAKRKKPPVEKYHDRVAGIYDTIYEGNPYWETVFELTWRHIHKYLPKNLSTKCLDVGCGTGKWGMQLLKTGYPTDFLDISHLMLDKVHKKLTKMELTYQPELYHLSVDDMDKLPKESYDFIIGQGDPLNCAQRPERAFKHMVKCLRPGGIILMAVDNKLAGFRHYFQNDDITGLEKFIKDGKTQWVTDADDEQYDLTMFSPDEIRRMCTARGLELLSIIGKTALPLRRFQEKLRDREQRAHIIRLEEKLSGMEAMLGCAAHLEFVARKPMA